LQRIARPGVGGQGSKGKVEPLQDVVVTSLINMLEALKKPRAAPGWWIF